MNGMNSKFDLILVGLLLVCLLASGFFAGAVHERAKCEHQPIFIFNESPPVVF